MAVQVKDYLPGNIASIIDYVSKWLEDDLIEIRLRINQPLQIITPERDFFLNRYGEKVIKEEEAYQVRKSDIDKAFMIISNNSLYALERQLGEGFITIPGGHRVGFTGQAVLENGKLKRINNINSLNYRITRELIGVASGVIEKIYNRKEDYIYNTLIISPPICGKTTLLRDLVRSISQGVPQLGIRGRKIGVVDERSEIAGAYNGVAQNKLGTRTDLLDNCPKARGMILLIRSMSPEVIAVDEIGRDEDVKAVKEAVTAGVSLITTVHGNNLDSIRKRPQLKDLIEDAVFQRYIILNKRNGIGTIEGIYDQEGKGVYSCR